MMNPIQEQATQMIQEASVPVDARAQPGAVPAGQVPQQGPVEAQPHHVVEALPAAEQPAASVASEPAPLCGAKLAEALHVALDDTYRDRDPVDDGKLRREIHQQLLDSDEVAAAEFFGQPEDSDEVDAYERARLLDGESH